MVIPLLVIGGLGISSIVGGSVFFKERFDTQQKDLDLQIKQQDIYLNQIEAERQKNQSKVSIDKQVALTPGIGDDLLLTIRKSAPWILIATGIIAGVYYFDQK